MPVKLLLMGLLSVVLLTCNAFIVSDEGRVNFLDPDNTLKAVDRNGIRPVADGWIEYNDNRDFHGLNLYTGQSPMRVSLIRFDPADIPDIVATAALHLNCLSFGSDKVYVYGVQVSWDEGLSWADTTAPGFYSSTGYDSQLVDTAATYTWDVTAILQQVPGSRINGFIMIEPSGSSMFESSRSGQSLSLDVQGFEYP